jgi:ribosome-associated protein
VVSQTSRSQFANKEIALERFAALLREALTPRPPRRKTRATLASKLRRLDDKKRQGERKRQRRDIGD